MKLFFSTPFFVLALVMAISVIPSNADSLRSSKDKEHNPLDVKADIRDLQAYTGYNNESVENDLNDGSDVTLLNRIIQFLLPLVNNAFKKVVPDPFDLDSAGRYNFGEIDLLFCKASAALDYDFGSITGLRELSVNSLRVIPGTERVQFNCLETLWNGIFDITIASRTNFTVNDVGAGVQASACGYSFNRSISGGVNTHQPMLRGAVNISGALLGTVATIDFANIADALQVGYGSLEVHVDGLPKEFNKLLGNVTSKLSVVMKEQLIDTVEPALEPIVEQTLQQSTTLSYGQALSLSTGFVKNEYKRRAVRLYQNTANFFGVGGGQ